MAALAEEELGALDPKIEELEQQLKVQLLPKDAADEKSAILEVRAGTGGEEAALFAGDLFRMYQRYADRHGWKVSRPFGERIRDRRLQGNHRQYHRQGRVRAAQIRIRRASRPARA